MAKEILMGMAETYDILFKIPQGQSVELRATAQDVTGYASGWLGTGKKVSAPTKLEPDMYATMNHGAHAGGNHETMDHAGMHHEHHAGCLRLRLLKL